MSRASSLMKCPQSWFFSGGPDIMVSQTGSDTRGIVYRLQMVVLHTDRHTHTKTEELLSTAETKSVSVAQGCPGWERPFSIFNVWKCHAAREYGPQSRV